MKLRNYKKCDRTWITASKYIYEMLLCDISCYSHSKCGNARAVEWLAWARVLILPCYLK